MTEQQQQKVRFISRVVSQGEDKLIIIVPRKQHHRIQDMKGEQVIVSLSKAL